MNPVTYHKKSTHILYDADVFSNVEDISFESRDWAQRSAIVGFAEGRGTTFFVQYLGRDFVLRHYQRGGLIARFLNDQYLWNFLRWTRPWREWKLLCHMLEQDLPVPLPAAIRVVRKTLLYRADIMTHRIAHARTLTQALAVEELSEGYWIAVGSMIRRFHEAGIYHADLNANNIMLDDGGRFYLIDFDRGRIRKNNDKWKKQTLKRLKRSLIKLTKAQVILHYNENNWHCLLRGYGWSDLEG